MNISHGSTLSVVPSSKIVSEYDQEIPQSQTADNPVAPFFCFDATKSPLIH